MDPRPGLNGVKGKTFRQAIVVIKLCLNLNGSTYFFIENVKFDDMESDWLEVCNALGVPIAVNARDYSYTTRNRAYWHNFPIPVQALMNKQPKRDWDRLMDRDRSIVTRTVYGQETVPPLGKSWTGDADDPRENTSAPVHVHDKSRPELVFLRPHEAEQLLGHVKHSTEGCGITALDRLQAIGNGWDINVAVMLLKFLPAPKVDNSDDSGHSNETQGFDWCLQFNKGDSVRVWFDNTAPPAWFNGTVQFINRSANQIRIEYPATDGYSNGSHTDHELDDGNVQPLITHSNDPLPQGDDVSDINRCLNYISHQESLRHKSFTVKTKPDRWKSSVDNGLNGSRPYLHYQQLRWSDYHKREVNKGEPGYISVQDFSKQIEREWNEVVNKSHQVHTAAIACDARCDVNHVDTISELTDQASVDLSGVTACSLPQNTTVNSVVAAVGRTSHTTRRIDCEQAGSDWDDCHDGLMINDAEIHCLSELPVTARDTSTHFELATGATANVITKNATHYVGRENWGEVTRRVTTDFESGGLIQDLKLEVAASAAKVVQGQMRRSIDLSVELDSDSKQVLFANAATKKRMTSRNPREPQSIREALTGPDAGLWKASIDKEWHALVDQGVFTLVPREHTRGKCVITSRWVFKIKSDGTYKSRCVGRGFQQWNSTIDSAYAPVARLGTVRVLLALAAVYGLDLWQLDIVTAFLNAHLGPEDAVFMELPECYAQQFPNMVLSLNKAIYGLKQSPRLWNRTLTDFFDELGFKSSKVDPCLFILRQGKDDTQGRKRRHQGSKADQDDSADDNNTPFFRKSQSSDSTCPEEMLVFIVVYVDDLLVVSTSEDLRNQVRQKLKKRFQMSQKVDNVPTELLGMRITVEPGMIELDQSRFALEIYGNYRDDDVTIRAAHTPMGDKLRLSKHDADANYMKGKDYRGLVGSLLYLTMGTRPDICFSVKELSRVLDSPGKEAWEAGQRLLEYVKNTHHYAIRYTAPTEGSALDFQISGLMHAYSDADWAGQIDDRRSTSGYVFFVAGGPVSWQSKTQKSVALSTAEAEYMALSDAAKEAIHLRALLLSIGMESNKPITIFEDNQAAQKIAENPVLHDRTKHIDIRYHFVRDLVEDLKIVVTYIETKLMIADLLTKAVTRSIHDALIDKLFGRTD